MFTHLWVGKVEVFYFFTVVNSATVGKPRGLKGGGKRLSHKPDDDDDSLSANPGTHGENQLHKAVSGPSHKSLVTCEPTHTSCTYTLIIIIVIKHFEK